MIFVNSMSDLFHDEVPDNYIAAVAQVMVAARWHTYQVLTKRSERLRKLLNTKLRFAAEQQHIWWGVSVEDQKYGLPRIEDLQNANAEVRFLSVEPLLEDLGRLDLRGIDWIIVGGESGAGARPMKKEWVLPLRDQCQRSGVPFFFKQWGGVRKAKAGRRLEGKTNDEFPKRVRHSMMAAEHCVSAARNIEALFHSGNVFPLSALDIKLTARVA
jgi:protein gp37